MLEKKRNQFKEQKDKRKKPQAASLTRNKTDAIYRIIKDKLC